MTTTTPAVYMNDEPAQRLATHGPAALTLRELVQMVTGSTEDAASVAAEGPRTIARAGSVAALTTAFPGLTKARASRLIAAVELGRRCMDESEPRARLDSPELVAAYLSPRHSGHATERFGIVALDSRHRLLGERIVATGGAHAVAVTPADTYRAAMPFSPRSVVAFHNHPGGDPTPSEEDKALTYRLARAGEVLGIALVDHIVLGSSGSFASFKQLGLI